MFKRHQYNDLLKHYKTLFVPVPEYQYKTAKKGDLKKLFDEAFNLRRSIIRGEKLPDESFSKQHILNLLISRRDLLDMKPRMSAMQEYNQSTKDQLLQRLQKFNKAERARASAKIKTNIVKNNAYEDLTSGDFTQLYYRPSENFTLELLDDESAKVANARQITFAFKVGDEVDITLTFVIEFAKRVISEYQKYQVLKPNDQVSFSINGREQFWANVRTRPFREVGTQAWYNDFFDAIQRILLDSNGELRLEECKIVVRSFNGIAGGTRTLSVIDKDDVRAKRSIIQINNTDNLCLARCLVVALNKNHPKYKQIKIGRNIQTKLAEELQQEVGISNELCTLDDVQRFQDHLKRNIIVLSREKVMYGNLQFSPDTNIYVYYHDNHYDLVNTVGCFFGTYYFCHKCLLKYNNKHHCQKETEKKVNWVRCLDCNCSFRSNEALEAHKCGEKVKCADCSRIYHPAKLEELGGHRCNHDFCTNCKAYDNVYEHKCYIQKTTPKAPTKNVMYFDFETNQETNKHEVNLVAFTKLQFDAYDHEHFEMVERNGNLFIIMRAVDEFCKYLISRRHNDYTVLAHNGKGYDFHFIRKWLIENGFTPQIINTGQKITYMMVKQPGFTLRFVDTLSFLTMPLKNFPKTFDLHELRKGYFPHYFNKTCHQNYVGPYPSKSHYGYETMKEKDKQAFLKWYDQQAGKTFDFAKEIVEYCISDVDILMRGMERLREVFMANCNVDPLNYITIASLCMDVYRSQHMPEDSIAIFKELTTDTHSSTSIEWLDYMAKSTDCQIRHACNSKEFKIGKYRVDGYCEQTNTVYEFNGCAYHGCPNCFDKQGTNHFGERYSSLLGRTIEKQKFIKSQGYNLVSTWECRWKKAKKKDETVKRFVKKYKSKVVDKLNMRDAFFGGRTNAIKLHHKCIGKQKIFYVDFTSLYPYINFTATYPFGHFTRITEPTMEDLNKSFGFVKCKILPPQDLYIPVLPLKTDKLVFPLCRSCALQSCQTCTHNEHERALIGTWCTPEIEKAIEKGYRVLELYEIYHFEQTTTELFKSYVATFLKIKQEASALPSNVITEEDKEAFAERYFAHQGVRLDPAKMNGKNEGLRCMAKLCLNSLWGKFGQRSNFKQTKYISSDREFYSIINDDKVNEVSWRILNEDILEVVFDLRDDCVKESANTNIAIASFTTCWARLKLYSVLETLNDQVLYFDTDSIIYVYDEENPNHKMVETGDYLGDLTNELDADDHIVEFVSTGPKCYAYTTNNGKFCCKVKGFSLNSSNSKYINFEQMKKMVYGTLSEIVDIKDRKITRSKDDFEIVNKYEEKIYKLVYDKRIIAEDKVSTLPYGYKKERTYVA